MKNSAEDQWLIILFRLLFVFSVPLMLIGHGAQVENLFEDFCDAISPNDSRLFLYKVAGTTSFDEDGSYDGLTGNGIFQVVDGSNVYSLNNDRTISPSSLEDGDTFSLLIDSNETEEEFGQVLLIKGLCQDDSQAIKLTSPIIADRIGRFFEASYVIREEDLGMENTVNGPSMSTYILSGGNTGAENINVPSSIDVLVNSVLVYDGDDGDINSPISFSASVNDEIEIIIESLAASGTTSQIWLHSPSGRGDLLSYNLVLGVNDSYRAIYKIKH